MAEPNLLTLLITGSLYVPDPGDPSGRRRVTFQRVGKKYGNLPHQGTKGLQRRAHVIPYDPRTPYQQALRSRMADAVAAWHAADETTRTAYRIDAKKRRHTGFNQWVSDWCRANPLNAADYAIPRQTLNDTRTIALSGLPVRLDGTLSVRTILNLAYF